MMKLGLLLIYVVVLSPPALTYPIQNDLDYNNYQHQTMKRKFGDILDELSSNYAPLEFKTKLLNLNFKKMAKNGIKNINQLKTQNQVDLKVSFFDQLYSFFSQFQDFHTQVKKFDFSFHYLPISIKSVKSFDGLRKYYVTHVDENFETSVKAGDQIVNFGSDVPIEVEIKHIQDHMYFSSSSPTNLSLIELYLTNRDNSQGIPPPSSNEIHIKFVRENKVFEEKFNWFYSNVPDYQVSLHGRSNKSLYSSLFNLDFSSKNYFSFSSNPFDLGQEISFLPRINSNNIKWDIQDYEEPKVKYFDAYTYITPDNKKIAYIRIPHFSYENIEQIKQFQSLISLSPIAESDGLIIDILNNPGGSSFYMYALASMLSPTPLEVPLHQMSATNEMVEDAMLLLNRLSEISDLSSAQQILLNPEDDGFLDGYNIDLDFVDGFKDFSKKLISTKDKCDKKIKKIYVGFKKTSLNTPCLSPPQYLLGLEKIKPNKFYNYKNPILILINEMDFSASEFFASILADNNRATLMGSKTSGSGGYMIRKDVETPDFSFSYTYSGSIAFRQIKSKISNTYDLIPIENQGISPSQGFQYDLSERDLKTNFLPFRLAIDRNIQILLNSPDSIIDKIKSIKKLQIESQK